MRTLLSTHGENELLHHSFAREFVVVEMENGVPLSVRRFQYRQGGTTGFELAQQQAAQAWWELTGILIQGARAPVPGWSKEQLAECFLAIERRGRAA